jgi:hypothetical protein
MNYNQNRLQARRSMLNVFLKNGLQTDRDQKKRKKIEGSSAKYLLQNRIEEEKYRDLDDMSLTEMLVQQANETLILENKLKDICYPLTELDESSYKSTVNDRVMPNNFLKGVIQNNDSKYFYGGHV